MLKFHLNKGETLFYTIIFHLCYNYIMYKNLYSRIADSLVIDGYIVVPDALQEDISIQLLTLAKKNLGFQQAGISASVDKHINSSKRRDTILWIDEDKEIQSVYLAFIQGLQEYLNSSLYLGIHYYESHFSIYKKGDFYEKHLDAFRGSKNRIVTTVFYLNEEWNKKDGGELIIYNINEEKIKKVIPKINTLVVFLSDKFPHKVMKTNKNRYSIAGWYRVDKR